MSPSPTWNPPNPRDGAVIWTRAWRIVTYGDAFPQAARLYVALGPESLVEGYELLFPLLDERQLCHRHVRSPELLRAMEGLAAWAGKSVVIDPSPEADPEEVARALDAQLAGRGLIGPSLIAGAQPFGGRTGLVFLKRQEPRAEQGGARQWLARLLGEGRAAHEPRSAGVHG
ncbi:MAG: hypothetical protein AB2385_08715 [Symbiobacterium sp.]|uniref:hypothetical protein n=1 Tax=Symbiobacterium sp. TaxID=1971213 RepID=UPI0034648C85